MKILLLTISIALLCSSEVNASFFIDYQGLEKKEITKKTDERYSPNGFRLLTDGLKGLIYEVGTRPRRISKTSSFSDDIEFKYAIGSVIPKDWAVYVDEKITAFENVTFSSNNEDWINVVARIGAKYGYKYILNWSTKTLQVSADEYFNEPDKNAPIAVEIDGGELFYIYKTKNKTDNGYMIVDGEIVPIKTGN